MARVEAMGSGSFAHRTYSCLQDPLEASLDIALRPDDGVLLCASVSSLMARAKTQSMRDSSLWIVQSLLWPDSKPEVVSQRIVSYRGWHSFPQSPKGLSWGASQRLHDGSGGGGLVAQSCLTLATPWSIVHRVPLSMEFPRQEYFIPHPYLSQTLWSAWDLLEHTAQVAIQVSQHPESVREPCLCLYSTQK